MKTGILKWGAFILLGACFEPGKAVNGNDEDGDGEPEGSSEPSFEGTEEGEGQGSGETDPQPDGAGQEPDPDNGNGSTDGNNGSNGSNGSTGGTLTPDVMLFVFQNGYIDGDVASVSFASGDPSSSGSLGILLYDSIAEDYCAIDWVFDESTTGPDVEYDDGVLLDAFSGSDIEVWYGFVVLSVPETRGSCGDLHSDWLPTLDAFLVDRPGFGYGQLGPDIQISMESDHYYEDWNATSEYIFGAVASTTVFSEGERIYLPVNQGFAYPVDEQGMTQYSPSEFGMFQGIEIPLDNVPFADGFYTGQYYFGIALH